MAEIASLTSLTAPSLLDALAPAYDASSRHVIRVAAATDVVYDVARHPDLGSLLLIRILMAIRSAPAWLARLTRRPSRTRARPGGDCSVGAVDFTLLAEWPGQEFVLGIMGRFWTPTGGVVATTADDFRRPPPDGLAQGFWNFRVVPSDGGTELSTETRVRCSDPATRRRFLRYWRVIRFGSGAIRGSVLRHIRDTAERQ